MIPKRLLGPNVVDFTYEHLRYWVENYAVADLGAAKRARAMDIEWFALRPEQNYRLRPFLPIEFPVDERDPLPKSTFVVQVRPEHLICIGSQARPHNFTKDALNRLASRLKVPFIELDGTEIMITIEELRIRHRELNLP